MKKVLIISLSILFSLSMGCASWFYDCQTASENMVEVCEQELMADGMTSADKPVFISTLESMCENGGFGTDPWTDEEIECFSTAETCDATNLCNQ
ncbi:MAG: hypothetical protein OEZ13_01760 [Spirochaetia bacterium]|nr:hypothetical protein [Spirochaetia bacterium]